MGTEREENLINFERAYLKALKYRRTSLLLRAMKGLHFKELVVDTCCGWGQDLMCLRVAFQRVVGIERHPEIYQFLCCARDQFSLDGVEILPGDAKDYRGEGRVFYMDPMYSPGNRAKSMAKKSIQLLKQMCGSDTDQEELLLALLDKNPKRVVVKRGVKTPPLFSKKVKFSLPGRLIRFDIY